MKALITGSNKDALVMAQQEPFIYNRKLLRSTLDLDTEYAYAKTFSEIGKLCNKHNSDVVFLFPSWWESPIDAEEVLKDIRDKNPHRKLLFVDPFAQTTSKYFNVLPYVDRFLKRQSYKDLDEYKRQFIGGSMFTDFLANQKKLNFEGWHLGSEIPEGYDERIIPGWNLGTAKRFMKALRKPLFWNRRPRKNLDIFCRLSLGCEKKKEWYCEYRIAAVEALKPLESDYKVVASGGFVETSLVPRRQYIQEIKSSRIVFSPFGWGEICWRDFEAVCYDCLLVKPSMAHIDTKPNIFIPEETYVPVRWDFSDLKEKCHFYLTHPNQAARIVNNARRVYSEYFEKGEFVKTIAKLLG